MKRVAAEKYRDIDFSRGKPGTVIKPEPGKTKVSIRFDNALLEYFRDAVNRAGGGSYSTLINDALLDYVHRHPIEGVRRSNSRPQRTRSARR